MESGLTYFLMIFTSPQLLGLTALGTFLGIYAGALPGISVTMATSVLISFTFSWDLDNALALMVGVFCGGVYGGSRTAILLNIPGTPAAVATALDGYPLAKLGLASQAIGVTTLVSVLGGLLGTVVLAIFAPLMSGLALKFAPRDFLLLALIGLLLVGSMTGGSLTKGVLTASLGVMIGLVGLDEFTAKARLTFDAPSMLGGISYVAAMIGFFGFSEALHQIRSLHIPPVRQKIDRIIPSWGTVAKFLPLSLRSSAIGVVIGALPGAGGDIAALIAYDHAKRSTKAPSRPFGQGAYEGIVAPEAANNAAVSGAFIPMLTLGIPGDAVTAIMIGGLYIHGLRPGPMLMIETPYLFWFMVAALFAANIFLLVFGLTGIRFMARVITVPRGVLIPCVAMLSIIGTYAIQSSITDVYWMLAFGVLGYLFKLYGYPVGPIILGVILGPLLDSSFRRAMISSHSSVPEFLLSFVTNPISLVLAVGFLGLVLRQTPLWSLVQARRSDRGDRSQSEA